MEKINSENLSSKRQTFTRKALDILWWAVLISIVESLSHPMIADLLKNFYSFGSTTQDLDNAFSVIGILSNTVEHLPLGLLCILTCAGSISNFKTFIYMIIWLLLHFAYEWWHETTALNIFIVAMIWELCAYIYNHKKELLANINNKLFAK